MKGQLFSFDFIFSLFIFFGILGFVIYFWLTMPTYKEYGLQEAVNDAAVFLTIKKLGNENMLECKNVVEFSAKNYGDIKSEIGHAQYDVYVELKNTSAVCGGDNVNFGYNFTNKTYVSSVARIVSLDNEKMQMVVKLYE